MPKGGIRPGGGRRPLPEDSKKKTFAGYISPEANAFIQAEKERTGESNGMVIDRLVKFWQEHQK